MKRRVITTLLAAAALIAASGFALHLRQQRARTNYTDGAAIRQPLASTDPREVLWTPPEPLSESINTPQEEYEPKLSADGLMLCFVRGKAGAKEGANADIWIATRTDPDREQWSEPKPLAAINTPEDELGPAFSADGRALYFASNRPGGLGGYDLWMSHRDGADWLPPVNLGPNVNTASNEYGPALAPGGDVLYFASNRAKAGISDQKQSADWPATLREPRQRRDYDLYSATIADGNIAVSAPLNALNTSSNEGAPVVSPAGDFLWFSSDRPGGRGGFDLYRSRRLHGGHLRPAGAGDEINTAANELDPALGMGGFALHFSSDRPLAGGAVLQPERGDYNLFASQSREVYQEVEADAPWIDWAALWAIIAPSVPWLLLGLLLTLFLLALVRSIRSGKLSLLARCLLASLIVHLVLMIIFTFWQVTTSLVDGIQRGGGTKVVIGSPGGSDALITQVRGNLTDVSISASSATLARADSTMPIETAATLNPSLEIAPSALPDALSAAAVHPAESALQAVEIPAPPTLLMAITVIEPMRVAIPAPAQQSAAPEAQSLTRIADAGSAASARVQPVSMLGAPAAAPSVVLPPADSAGIESAASFTSATSPRAAEPVPSMSLAMAGLTMDPPSPAAAGTARMRLPSESAGAAEGDHPAEEASLAMMPSGAASTRQQPLTNDGGEKGAAASIALAPATASTGEPNDPSAVTGLALDHVRDSAVSAPSPSQATAPSVSAGTLDLPELQPTAVAVPGASAMPGGATGPQGEPEIHVAGAAHQSSRADTSGIGGIDRARGEDSSVRLPPSVAGNSAVGDQRSAAAKVTATDASMAFDPGVARPFPGLGRADAGIPAAAMGDVRIPTETAPPVDQYAQRTEETRAAMVKRLGGSEATERAVALSLKWLAAHQSADGRWAARGFDAECRACGGIGKYDTDIATTALSLLCFFASDHTHQKDGPYRSQVQRGLAWLLAQQKPTGDLRGGETMYSHGIATIALAEAFGMTHDAALRRPVITAVDFIIAARNTEQGAGGGGWRYEPGQFGDTSVLGWQVMALTSARRAGIDVPEEAFDAARRWLDMVSMPSAPGLYAYQPGQKSSPSMTAEGMFVQQLLGTGREEARMRQSARHVTQNLPRWNREPNTYYWYYATLALFQQQGAEWDTWNTALTGQLLANQRTSGPAAGSWDPVDGWSRIGGRIYQTAICTLSLEVYYRYLPMYATPPVAAASPARP